MRGLEHLERMEQKSTTEEKDYTLVWSVVCLAGCIILGLMP